MVHRPPSKPQDIAIVGAGLVGSACALALAEDGHRVTLFDPDPPGAGTSSGNAGGNRDGGRGADCDAAGPAGAALLRA